MRRALLRVTAVIVAVEIASYAFIAAINPFLVDPIRRTAAFYRGQSAALTRFLDGDRGIWVLDSVLGWGTVPSAYRGPEAPYPPTPRPGRIRVAAFGNSFTRGADVSPQASWLDQTGARTPILETLNFGVAAYGTDQSLLQYRRDGRPCNPDIVLIGLAPDNFRRNVNVYRRFLTAQGPPLGKPVFVADGHDSFVLVPNPLRDSAALARLEADPAGAIALGRYDAWYEPLVFENPMYDWSAAVRVAVTTWIRARRAWDPDDAITRRGRFRAGSRAFRVTRHLLVDFAAEVRTDGAAPAVVVLPDRFVIAALRRGRPHPLGAMIAELRTAGIPVLDLSEALVPGSAGPLDSLFTAGLHYTPHGGALIAAWLGPRLSGLIDTAAVVRPAS